MKHFNIFKQVFFIALALCFGTQQSYALSGAYTVGTGGNYATLADAIYDLNTVGVTGPVYFFLRDGSYSGSSWQGQINTYPGMSASNPVSFEPESGVKGTVSISSAGSSTANYIIGLNNANYVYVKKLTLINTSTSYGAVINVSGSSSYDSVTDCTLTGPVVTSGTAGLAVVAFGISGVHTGTDIYVNRDTINNGSAGAWFSGTGAGQLSNIIFNNNRIVNPYYYGFYAGYTNNFIADNNLITTSSTGINTGIYLSYNANGTDVSGNTVTITTTTPTVYTMYNNYVNSASPTASATINNNTITITATTGSPRNLYNNYCNNLTMTGNTMNVTATSSGVVYAPTMSYYGSNNNVSNNTFGMSCTTGGMGTSTYYFLYYANNATVRNNTFNISTTSGQLGNSSYQYMYYATGCKVNKNVYNITASSAVTMYGALGGGYYFNYYGTSTTFDSNRVTLNAPSGVGTCYYLGYYGNYYTTDCSFSSDTLNYTVASGTLYGMGIYVNYYGTNLKFNKNVINVNATGATSYTPYYMGYYVTNLQANDNRGTVTNTSGTSYMPYYMGYNNFSSQFNNNTFTGTATTGSLYMPYMMNYYNQNSQYNNNSFTASTTSGTMYMPYYMSYYASGSSMRNNTFSATATSSSTIYCPYYLNAYGSADTVEGNTWTASTSGGTIYNYNYYLNNITKNNTWNLNNTSGSIYHMYYYCSGGEFSNNTINATTLTGTIYNGYDYCPSTYSGTLIKNNKYTLKSTSGGTVYAYYGQYPNSNIWMGNVFMSETTGPSYLFYNPSGNYGNVYFYNNTFHSNSTNAGTNTLIYNSGGSSSYPGKTIMANNIFSRSDNTATSVPVYIADTTYFQSDYSLMYSPGTITRQCVNPAVTATTLQAWRVGTKRDMNSLFYDPGYTNAATYDFRPNPSNPNAWSVNGRGKHIANDTLDILGNVRAKTPLTGVPDLGAYEFTPTSTPPDAVATPTTPVANSTQAFTFGEDTVGTIKWGATVPSFASVKQYTGTQATPMPTGVGRMYGYMAVQTPTVSSITYGPKFYYKDPWIGDISSEANARIAKSSNGGVWMGYNFANGITDLVNNTLTSAADLDSMPSRFTGVENGRIGIRCVVVPTGLAHSNITANAADEKWDPIFNPLGYQYVVDGNRSVVPPSTSVYNFSATNTVNLSGLTEDTWIYVHVRSICGPKDTSGWAIDSFQTLITCHAPTLQISSLDSKQAIVYWDTVKTAINYEYEISQSSTPPVYGTPTASRSVLATYLKSGTTYYAHVRTICNSMYAMSAWATTSFMTKWAANVSGVDGEVGIVAYPNPVKDILVVELKGKRTGVATLTITDVTGKILRTANVTAEKTEVNLGGLSSGMYFVKYTDDANTQLIKVNKE